MHNAAPRLRGRPRDHGIDRRILEATLRVVAERGIGGAAMDEIALRSGVSKATIYGRWPSKESLCIEAIRHFTPELPAYNAGDPRNDCARLLGDLLAAPPPRTEGLFARIVAEISGSTELARIFRDRIVEPPRRICEQIVRRAIAVRQLAKATNVTLAVDLLVGPVFYRRLIGDAIAADPALPVSIVDAVWAAFAAT
ncbi:MAG: TetR/AcrR family transcriptional regulator [Candidatus Eremiobacteraeota bacterium]|nr:TetR/AcrR family transcriptional regulator [Candidatus Eremiobacteraeota bacterium]